MLNAYEIKWNEHKNKFPESFLSSYPNNTTTLLNKDNFDSFIGV